MAKAKRATVPEEDRAKLFLWCARHCCFCGKECTTNIEIHHIDGERSNNELDNLIPVCFDCHGELQRYNSEHPRGSKYRYLEIKKRREQIYELHTLPYLRKASIRISKYIYGSKRERSLGDTSCTVMSLSDDIAIRLRLRIEAYHDDKQLTLDRDDLYSGSALWNLNPSQIVFGHFRLPILKEAKPFLYRVEIFWSIMDILDREHQMLPFSYMWSELDGDWWFDPRVTHNK
jgi:hypothetical protein